MIILVFFNLSLSSCSSINKKYVLDDNTLDLLNNEKKIRIYKKKAKIYNALQKQGKRISNKYNFLSYIEKAQDFLFCKLCPTKFIESFIEYRLGEILYYDSNIKGTTIGMSYLDILKTKDALEFIEKKFKRKTKKLKKIDDLKLSNMLKYYNEFFINTKKRLKKIECKNLTKEDLKFIFYLNKVLIIISSHLRTFSKYSYEHKNYTDNNSKCNFFELSILPLCGQSESLKGCFEEIIETEEIKQTYEQNKEKLDFISQGLIRDPYFEEFKKYYEQDNKLRKIVTE